MIEVGLEAAIVTGRLRNGPVIVSPFDRAALTFKITSTDSKKLFSQIVPCNFSEKKLCERYRPSLCEVQNRKKTNSAVGNQKREDVRPPSSISHACIPIKSKSIPQG